MMLRGVIISFLFTRCVFAQINGEFWWLNSKVMELNGKIIPPPLYEDLTEFDTDDTRIVFNENNHAMRRKIINNPNNMGQFKMKPIRTQMKRNKMVNRQDKIVFGDVKREDNNKFVWPSDDGNNKNKNNNIATTHRFSDNDQTTKVTTTASNTQDQFVIKFPERDTFYIQEPIKTVTTTEVTNTQTISPAFESTTELTKNITDAIFFGNTNNPEHGKKRKSICTYITKYECINENGFIYTAEFGKNIKIGPKDPTLICCVLPLPIKEEVQNKPKKALEGVIYFPDKISPHKRSRRSNDELRQRNVLLQRRRTQDTKTKAVPTERVVVENEDPYWNIKNSFNPTKKTNKVTDYEYKEDDAQEYADEFPRPGLLGIYSDSGRKPTSWSVIRPDKTYYGEDADYDDVDSDTSNGYATIDPREGNTKTKRRRKPIKLSTHEEKFTPESQIINFQSNPNFEVLQGFKLLNLVRNKNKMSSQITEEKSDESGDSEDKESILSTAITSTEHSDDDSKENLQLFANCGKTATKRQKGTQMGDAEEGAHPWLVVVTPSNDQSDILCYGTLVHPRAALTAAECVSEIPPNGIVVLAGLWKLNDKTNVKKRTPQVHLHPKYRPGSAANNLAVLTWSLPFKLCDEVQIACVAEPQQGRDCMLYGWGGFDQALRLRSRWQRASMHECNQMSPVTKSNLPSNAFCANVQSRGTVSGVGGPLMCHVNGRDAMVGVAVSRNTDVVFLPAKEWAMQAQEFLYED